SVPRGRGVACEGSEVEVARSGRVRGAAGRVRDGVLHGIPPPGPSPAARDGAGPRRTHDRDHPLSLGGGGAVGRVVGGSGGGGGAGGGDGRVAPAPARGGAPRGARAGRGGRGGVRGRVDDRGRAGRVAGRAGAGRVSILARDLAIARCRVLRVVEVRAEVGAAARLRAGGRRAADE